jgi:hypothetical protein
MAKAQIRGPTAASASSALIQIQAFRRFSGSGFASCPSGMGAAAMRPSLVAVAATRQGGVRAHEVRASTNRSCLGVAARGMMHRVEPVATTRRS